MEKLDPPLVDDFRDLLVTFVDHRVEFLLIGGWALALHGYARGTDDMDVLVRPTSENARRVYDALATFGAPVAAHGVTADLFARQGYGYRMGLKPNVIEVLTEIDGIDFDEAAQDARTFTLEGREVPFIGRAALLKNKKAAARPKDLADVAWLEEHADEDDL